MVVLPDPDTPVTTVSRPLGNSASSGLTVWICAVEKQMLPLANISSRAAHFLILVSALPERKGPICEAAFSSMAWIVPWAMT